MLCSLVVCVVFSVPVLACFGLCACCVVFGVAGWLMLLLVRLCVDGVVVFMLACLCVLFRFGVVWLCVVVGVV